jgi:hypothetical protein
MKLAGNKNSPHLLENPLAIARFIESNSVDFVDEESIENYVDGCEAVLIVIDIQKIAPSDEDHHIPDESKQSAYNDLSMDSMPPIVIDEKGSIVDGHHRYRAALFNGTTHIVAYQLQEIGLHLEMNASTSGLSG